MMRFLGVAVGLSALFSLVQPARADLLFSSIPNLDVTGGSREWCTSCNHDFETLEQVTLASAVTITSVSLVTSSVSGTFLDGQNGFQFVVYDSTLTNLLASPSVSGITVTPMGFNSQDLATGSVTPVTLGPGTYDIGFFNANGLLDQGMSGGNGSAFDISWNTKAYLFNLAPQAADSGDIGFQLFGGSADVPEPGSLTLLATGLAGLKLLRRRR